ncbi:MAG: 1-pyrroline-5-carboxylate dehydrogenase [Flavobacteriaceae bacterium TMED179]|nr:MAG: 1-pyrroline-5-carboxylate dehydrogenase [Flavobacteriaceae bacterium TMED179]|tara:strand:- start:15509 stop:17134 length:1626 start_codon:yes stop_codon:yes gene_type:complete
MSNSISKVPYPSNEPVLSYSPGSPEKEEVLKMYNSLYNNILEIPMRIGSKDVKTGDIENLSPPHDHNHIIGSYHKANKKNIEDAISTALNAKMAWSRMPWESRAAIFLKAADLIAGPYRSKINAATMIAQSKTIYQAEIDAACEFIDFLRFNVQYMQEIYQNQPESSSGIWNRLTFRPLEGFVYAVSPFNFTAIAGNLCASVAMMGNVVVWKPSDYQVYSANVLMEVFKEAGLPDGVINMVFGDPEMITNTVLKTKEFAGIHYTGSTSVFRDIWSKIGKNIKHYNSYPRIVGETGGKDFIIAHSSANSEEVATGIIRGAFEFQGQKCSAASRVYLPKSKADSIIEELKKELKTISIGSPANFKNFMTAMIHKSAFDRLVQAIEQIKKEKDIKIIAGGNYDDSKGYFIEPTVAVTTNPNYDTMKRELFGPLVTLYIYEDCNWKDTLNLVDKTSEYALTGAVYSKDRYALEEALTVLENSAGNFYINDKPTGAVVGQQPFGGARGSGTNDKAGSAYNLLRWVSPRLIKETFVPAVDYRYPFLG